jgi:Tfp pilus assembly protein PilN
MRAVNLLPEDWRGSQRRSTSATFLREPLLVAAIGVAILVVVAVGLAAHTAGSKVSSRHSEIRQLDAQLSKLSRAKSVPSATATRSAESRFATLATVAASRTSWDSFLASISRVLPEDVWLLELSAEPASAGASTTSMSQPGSTTASTPQPTAPGAAPAASPGAPSGFTLTGYTYSQPSVARLLRRLELVPWLHDVSLVTSTKAAMGQYTLYQFTVGANVVQIPEAKS